VEECFVYGVVLEHCVRCAVNGLLRSGRRVHLISDATTHADPNAGRDTLKAFSAEGGARYSALLTSDIAGL
jgi:nicotinamidase-related amidase